MESSRGTNAKNEVLGRLKANMSKNDDPLEVAKKLGYSIALDLGAEAFIELQLSFTTRLLPKFIDNPLFRVRQNVLLYWDQSYLKTTTIDEFEKTVPDNMRVIDITSMSPQSIFGTISEDRKNIIRPAFSSAYFAKITELLSFLGTGNTMRDVVNSMNKVMEGENVTRQLLKLGEIGFDVTKIEKLKEEGIHYDPHRAQLQYRPDICVWAASRPMPNRVYTYLRGSGHLYRYHILQHEVSDEEAKRFFTEDIRPNLGLQRDLKLLNEQLANITVKKLEMPSKKILDQIFPPLEEIVRDEIAIKKRRLAEVIDIRTRGDLTRELVAKAFLSKVTENGFEDIDEFEYTDKDVEFILQRLDHFVEFKLNPLFAEEWTQRGIRKKRPKDQVKELVLKFLRDCSERSRSEIVDYVRSKMRVSVPTIDNTLRELLKEGGITSPRFGYYKSAQK